MLATKRAIEARLRTDAQLVAALGGTHVYQRTPTFDVGAVLDGSAKGVVTYWFVVSSPDRELPYASELVQIDGWFLKSDDGDAAMERIDAFVPWSPGISGSGILPSLVGRRLAEPIYAEASPPDQLEDVDGIGNLHHKVRQYRVATYAA